MQIDPKASERESPYVGMANNPVVYVDPLGDTIRVNGSEEFKKQYEIDRGKMAETKEGAALLKILDESKYDVVVKEAFSILGAIQNFFSEGSGDDDHVLESQTEGNYPNPIYPDHGVTVKVSQIDGVEVDNVKTSSTEILMHEFQHASDIVDGTLLKEAKKSSKNDPSGSKLREFAETRAVEAQNVIRKANGDKPRTHYAGKRVLSDDGTRIKRK
jgi:hypothetical protein